MIIFKKISYADKYHDDNAIIDVISYICQPSKTRSGIVGGVGVDPKNIANSMIAVSKHFKKYSRIRLHHFVISFGKEDLQSTKILPEIAQKIAAYIGSEYQTVFALHEDTENLHIHFVFNAVSYIDGKKYRGGISEYYQLIGGIGAILSTYRLYPLIPVKYTPTLETNHE